MRAVWPPRVSCSQPVRWVAGWKECGFLRDLAARRKGHSCRPGPFLARHGIARLPTLPAGRPSLHADHLQYGAKSLSGQPDDAASGDPGETEEEEGKTVMCVTLACLDAALAVQPSHTALIYAWLPSAEAGAAEVRDREVRGRYAAASGEVRVHLRA